MKRALLFLAIASCAAHADTLVVNYDGRIYTYTGTMTVLDMDGLDGNVTFAVATRHAVPDTSAPPAVSGEWTVTIVNGKVYDDLACYATFTLEPRELDLQCQDDE